MAHQLFGIQIKKHTNKPIKPFPSEIYPTPLADTSLSRGKYISLSKLLEALYYPTIDSISSHS